MFRVERVEPICPSRHSTDEHPSRKRFDRIYSVPANKKKQASHPCFRDVLEISAEGRAFCCNKK